MLSGADSVQAAKKAFKQGRYEVAIQILEEFCSLHQDRDIPDLIQAQVGLVKAYQQAGQLHKARELTHYLAQKPDPDLQDWATKKLIHLDHLFAAAAESAVQEPTSLGSTASPQPMPTATPEVTPLVQAPQSFSSATPIAPASVEPEIPSVEPEIPSVEPEIPSVEPEIPSVEPEIPSVELEIPSVEPKISSVELEIPSVEPEIPSVEPKISSVEPKISSVEPKISSVEPLDLASAEPQPVVSSADPLPSPSPSTLLDLNDLGGNRSEEAAPKPSSAFKRVRVPISSTAGPLVWVIVGTVAVVLVLVFWQVAPETFGFRLRIWPPRSVAREFNDLLRWLLPGLGYTLNLATLVYFLSTPLLDLLQRRLYQIRWITLAELNRHSPAAGQILQQVCTQQDIKIPALGIIPDPHPVAFSYGASPNGSRIIVSQGLLDRLEASEIAAVVAHELGRICHRDSAVLTLLTTPLQLLYWLYVVFSRMGEGRKKDLVGHLSPLIYTLYVAASFPFFFLCRVGTYHADHFATEITGDPNSLSRALIKLSYGVLNESRKLSRPSFLLDQVRLFGLFDPKTATAASTAYQVADQPQRVRQIFLWDIFSPWARWMQVNSSHPLLGKRIRVLGQYAERLRQTPEFNMEQIPADRKKLDLQRLTQQFRIKILYYAAEVVGLVGFWTLGVLVYLIWPQVGQHVIFGAAIFGFGAGMLAKIWFVFPRGETVPSTVLAVMSDPYATPLSQHPVTLRGQLFGRGRVGYQLGAELRVQDETGTIPIRYTSRFGPVGNLFLSVKALRPVMGAEVEVTGWLRRGISPWLDVSQIRRLDSGVLVRSHPRFWLIVFGALAVTTGVLVIFFYPPIGRTLARVRGFLSWRTLRRFLQGGGRNRGLDFGS